MATPTTLPTTPNAVAGNLLPAMFGVGTSHSTGINLMIADILAVWTKLGIGASTPVANSVLVGNGTGTSAFLTGLTNAYIAAGAAIAYSKLSLANSIVNADIAAGAAIAYSKLNLAGSIVSADITDGTIVGADLAAGSTMKKIAEVSGTGSSGVLEFASIPQTYRSLIVELVGRSSNAGGPNSVQLTFETSPSAGTYVHQRLYGTGATAGAQENVATSSFILAGAFPGSTAVAAAVGTSRIALSEYANGSVMKPVLIQALGLNTVASGGLISETIAGFWQSGSGIDRIRMTLAAGNWTTITRATLFGTPA